MPLEKFLNLHCYANHVNVELRKVSLFYLFDVFSEQIYTPTATAFSLPCNQHSFLVPGDSLKKSETNPVISDEIMIRVQWYQVDRGM